jgi:cleavage and polyadenylation specificity factor subunit 3
VESISFSAHSDFLQTSEFIDLVKPSHIVLVHGEKNQMARLHDALVRKYKQADLAAEQRRAQPGEGEGAPLWRPQNIFTPENGHTVSLAVASHGKCRVVGALADLLPGIGRAVQGLVRSRAEQSRDGADGWGEGGAAGL